MKLNANQIAALKKIAEAPKSGLPMTAVHFQTRTVLDTLKLITISDRKGVKMITITAEGRKQLKNAEKAAKATAAV